jgi:cytochrome c-type biogenesis protein CcmE
MAEVQKSLPKKARTGTVVVLHGTIAHPASTREANNVGERYVEKIKAKQISKTDETITTKIMGSISDTGTVD